jgi:hypothetical protein
MNDTYKRFPRTLNQAFGPYQDGMETIETPHRMDWQDKLVLWACVAAAVAVIVIMVLE